MISESQKVEKVVPNVTPAKKIKKKKVVRPKTGYNLFVADKIKEIKDVDQKEKMKHVGQLWKNATTKEKTKYSDMAAKLKKTVSGDNQKEKLLNVSASWKKLSDKEKQKYKDKAKQLSD